MRPDKDRPSTWRKYRDGMCDGCFAGCCTMPVEVKIEDLIRLGLASEDEKGSFKKVFKRLKKERLLKSFRDSTGLFMFEQFENGDCIFLNQKTRLCKVYENRPGVCREFPSIGPKPGYCPCYKK